MLVKSLLLNECVRKMPAFVNKQGRSDPDYSDINQTRTDA